MGVFTDRSADERLIAYLQDDVTRLRTRVTDLEEENRRLHAQMLELVIPKPRVVPVRDDTTNVKRDTNTRSWPKIQQELERRNSTPENRTADYWHRKNAELEAQSKQLDEQARNEA